MKFKCVVCVNAAGSEVTVYIKDCVCFLRNVLEASLFTQASLHIFEREKGRVRPSAQTPGFNDTTEMGYSWGI